MYRKAGSRMNRKATVRWIDRQTVRWKKRWTLINFISYQSGWGGDGEGV